MEDIVLPNGLSAIDDNAFNCCESLTHLNIPSSVRSIGDYAFGKCTGFTEITLPDGLSELGSRVFDMCNDNLIIHYRGCDFSPQDFNGDYPLQDINDIADSKQSNDVETSAIDFGF